VGRNAGRGRSDVLSPHGGTAVRRAGTGRLPGGRHLTWTVADGRRGRRWRAITTSADGRLVQALLLEVGVDGSLLKIEVASPAGLLTLHPEVGEGTLHGNIVRPSGISHVTLPWSARHLLFAGGSPVTGAVAAAWLEREVPVGQGRAIPAVEIAADLEIRQATWRVARVAERRWHLLAADGGPSVAVALDEDGIPTGLEAAAGWPLELDPSS
jgi:hypothetical protein